MLPSPFLNHCSTYYWLKLPGGNVHISLINQTRDVVELYLLEAREFGVVCGESLLKTRTQMLSDVCIHVYNHRRVCL